MEAQVETLPVVSTRGLEGVLVAGQEPSTSRKLPNHLTDTKTFSTVQERAVVKARPSAIHFNGYRVNQLYKQTLHIINSTNDNISMHIIPPTTDHFSIHYHKQRSRLVPGLSLDVTVSFRPTEWKYYYDCVRIHCKGDHNLLVPIHAYPVMNTASFPRKVSFPATPIGRSHTHTINLQCDQPVEFEFILSFVQPHPAFTVTPMQGVVPANGKVRIEVTYAPFEFSTAIMKLQLETSQFNSKPVVCTFTGTSTPGLAVELYRKHQPEQPRKAPSKRLTATLQLAPLDKMREKRRKKKEKEKQSSEEAQVREMVFEGIRFPPNLNTPSAVAKVLAQEPGQLKASELKNVTSSAGTTSSKQIKEAKFLQKVKEAADHEKSVMLKWMTNLGSLPFTDEEKDKILKDRRTAEISYNRQYHIPILKEEETRTHTATCKRRTRTLAGKEEKAEKPLFDLQAENLWRQRYNAISRFVQAARKIVMRNRCERRLEKLRRLISDVKQGKDPVSLVPENNTETQTDRLTSFTFNLLPKSIPRHSDTTEAKKPATVNVSVEPTVVGVHHDPPLLSLRIPQHYKLMGYTPLLLPQQGTCKQSGLPRPLRTGAMEECANFTPIPGVNLSLLHQQLPEEILVEDVEERKDEEVDASRTREPLGLVPPPGLLKTAAPTAYLRHNILDPCPEVVAHSYRPLLQYSEITQEHHLLPLHTPTGAPSPQPKLDPHDGISGLMKWRQFPSQALTHQNFELCLDKQNKLSACWKPCHVGTFTSHLLPSSLPHQLLSGIQPDDYVDQQNRDIKAPTREMLHTEFIIPDNSTDNQHSREQSKRDMEAQYISQFGELGEKIAQRTSQLLSQLNNRQTDK